MKKCMLAMLLACGAGGVCAAPLHASETKPEGRPNKGVFIPLQTKPDSEQAEPVKESGKEFNERFQRALKKARYSKSKPYSVSFRLSYVPAKTEAVRLDDNYFIVHQTWLYWGLNNVPSSRMDLNYDWDFKRDDNKYWYVSKPSKYMILWAQNANRTRSGYRRTDGYIYIRISCDGKNSQVQFSYEKTNLLDTMILKKVVLDARKIRVCEPCVVDKAHIDLSKKAKWSIEMPRL